MAMKHVAAFALLAVVSFSVPAEAQAPCPELIRLRNTANEVWKQAMRVPAPERCEALNRASLAAEATLNYANDHRQSCGISESMLDRVEGYRRQAMQARDNGCAGRPLRPYPADIIQH